MHRVNTYLRDGKLKRWRTDKVARMRPREVEPIAPRTYLDPRNGDELHVVWAGVGSLPGERQWPERVPTTARRWARVTRQMPQAS